MRNGWCVIVLVAGATMLAQGQGASSVTVRVVAAESGRTIPNARVVFGRENSDAFSSGTTDANGSISLTRLSPGRYQLRALATGYASMELGEEPNMGGTLLSVPSDQKPIAVTIAMHRGSTIAGVVTNDLKEPVVGAQVGALGRWLFNGDYRYVGMAEVNPVKTDDRGAYRLIGLGPGEYMVRAVDGLSVAYASTAPINVGVDTEHTGINIHTKPAPSGTISGNVVGPGAELPGIQVRLFQEADPVEWQPITTARTDAGGRFSIDDVPFGKYVLIVQPGLVQNQPRVWGRTAVVVTASGIATPAINLRTGSRLAGRVSGSGPLRGDIQISPVGRGYPEASSTRGTVGADGTFVIANVAPGQYRWTPSQQLGQSGRLLLSVFMRDVDVSDIQFEVPPDSTIENVKITLTEPGHVTGTIRDAAGTPTTKGAVIVASTDPRHWSAFSTRIRIARPDTGGTYDVSGLPEGRYTVSLVTQLNAGQLWDPVFLKTIAKSRQIRLSQGQTATVDLRLK